VNTGKFPYLIFYEIFDAEVVIMRILHGARDPRSMPARRR
jgi:plasmid stabilization system protein ParE